MEKLKFTVHSLFFQSQCKERSVLIVNFQFILLYIENIIVHICIIPCNFLALYAFFASRL